MTEEEIDKFYDEDTSFTADNGLIALCTEGDGMDSVLVVNSLEPDTYGTVWYYDLANDCGIIPMRDKETGKPFHFLDWLEYWADRTAGLQSTEYFSFSETVQLPKAPDNPDIMGRKMGWMESKAADNRFPEVLELHKSGNHSAKGVNGPAFQKQCDKRRDQRNCFRYFKTQRSRYGLVAGISEDQYRSGQPDRLYLLSQSGWS